MSVLINIQNGQATTTSKQIAENFGKDHKNVLRDIENIQKDVLNSEPMFFETTEPDSYGREQKIYIMNRDGFTLLAMGFTGSDAIQWKLKYIRAFNEMEKQLTQPKAMTQAQILAAIAQQSADQEQKLIALNDRTETVERNITLIKDTIVERKENWREWVNEKIKAAAKARGNEYTQTYSEGYKLLESRAGCNLNTRVKNQRERLEKTGASQTKINSYRRIDAIEDEPRLREIFTSIVKEMAIKYVI